MYAQHKQSMIDKIKSKQDVAQFLKTIDAEHFDKFSIFKTDKTPKEYRVVKDCIYSNNYYKIDFNKDGATDLLIDAQLLLVIIDKGNNTFQINNIDNCEGVSPGYSLQAIDTAYSQLIVTKLGYTYDIPDTSKLRLVYKFNHIIAFNDSPSNIPIQSLKINFGGCFGFCPEFEMNITQDRIVIYTAVNNNERTGVYKTTLSEYDWKMLCDLLNYINFVTLNDSYHVNWTDDATTTISIHYNSNKNKRIHDYGQQGTIGLEALYSTILLWRKTQNWEFVEKIDGIPVEKTPFHTSGSPPSKYLVD